LLIYERRFIVQVFEFEDACEEEQIDVWDVVMFSRARFQADRQGDTRFVLCDVWSPVSSDTKDVLVKWPRLSAQSHTAPMYFNPWSLPAPPSSVSHHP
jgi:hypothetical protein